MSLPTRSELIEVHWFDFLLWAAHTPDERTGSVAAEYGGRRDKQGYQVSDNGDTLITDENFWLWFRRKRLDTVNQERTKKCVCCDRVHGPLGCPHKATLKGFGTGIDGTEVTIRGNQTDIRTEPTA